LAGTACNHKWDYRACRSPHLWKDPDTFRPERFSETNSNAAFNGAWAGYRPDAQGSSFYPNEVASDFAFIPFGGGARKCVGDQFALLEATVALTMLLRCAASHSFSRLSPI
jgi:cytochrome P450